MEKEKETKKKNIYEKLLNIQQELKAPKGQYNSFGKYKYRNCEDILEAVKPLLKKEKVVLTLSDDIIFINNRFYIKATALLINIENPEDKISNMAFAREEDIKKGMDGSQITGASSSYARKYALNGLFAIDDTKDSDTTNTGTSNEESKVEKKTLKATEKQISYITNAYGEQLEALLEHYNLKSIDEMDVRTASNLISQLKERGY